MERLREEVLFARVRSAGGMSVSRKYGPHHEAWSGVTRAAGWS